MTPESLKFPYPEHEERLKNYRHNDLLFEGKHFDAFAIKIQSPLYQQQYARLKYVAVNFAGLISKVSADMLFGEAIKIEASSDAQTKWLNDLMFENKMGSQLYESAMINSRLGDDILKIRSAPRHSSLTESTVIIEEVRPDIYFPKFANGNWRSEPEYQDLAFKVMIGKDAYVRVERHYPGLIKNFLYKMEDGGKLVEAPGGIKLYDPSLEPEQETGIDRSLIVHIPNWRAGDFWGISDYADVETLMYALNNRLTKNENVLDKHTDPILALPEGVLNEKGEVDKKALEIYTIPESEVGSGQPLKPEYITWNASLDNAFKQIDKLVEFLYLTSETSPGVFGMDKGGQAESGRALKLRLMRTIAKINRKKVFYDQGIKEALLVAQQLAQVHGYSVLGNRLPGTPELPSIVWADGLPIDDLEQVELETKKIEAGIQSKVDAIARIDNLDPADAEKKLKEINDENPIKVPTGAKVPADPDDDEEV